MVLSDVVPLGEEEEEDIFLVGGRVTDAQYIGLLPVVIIACILAIHSGILPNSAIDLRGKETQASHYNFCEYELGVNFESLPAAHGRHLPRNPL